MSAFNDRRTGTQRRKGDRRWLGNFTGRKAAAERRADDRRSGMDRRKKTIFERFSY